MELYLLPNSEGDRRKAGIIRNGRTRLNWRADAGFDGQHRDAPIGRIIFLDIVMPNGRTLANCEGDHIWQIGTAISKYACRELAQGQTPKARFPRPNSELSEE